MKVRLANLNQIRYIIMAISTSGEEKKGKIRDGVSVSGTCSSRTERIDTLVSP